MFQNSPSQKNDVFHLVIQDVSGIGQVLDYMYTSHLDINQDNVQALLDIAQCLQVPNLLSMCNAFLKPCPPPADTTSFSLPNSEHDCLLGGGLPHQIDLHCPTSEAQRSGCNNNSDPKGQHRTTKNQIKARALCWTWEIINSRVNRLWSAKAPIVSPLCAPLARPIKALHAGPRWWKRIPQRHQHHWPQPLNRKTLHSTSWCVPRRPCTWRSTTTCGLRRPWKRCTLSHSASRCCALPVERSTRRSLPLRTKSWRFLPQMDPHRTQQSFRRQRPRPCYPVPPRRTTRKMTQRRPRTPWSRQDINSTAALCVERSSNTQATWSFTNALIPVFILNAQCNDFYTMLKSMCCVCRLHTQYIEVCIMLPLPLKHK